MASLKQARWNGRNARGGETEVRADEAYQLRQRNVEVLMRHLKRQLEDHALEQQNDSKNWGYVGDLDHVQEQLTALVNQLGE